METIEAILRLIDTVFFGPAFPKHGSEHGGDRFHFFLCHAGEDKGDVARPIAKALRAGGFSVWFDEFELKPGDSLSQSIDRGLAQSRFGIVVLSHAFFGKNWPARELRGLVAREVQGKAAILPVWHGVTRDDILAWSPPLADLVAVDTTRGIKQVIDALISVVNPSDFDVRLDGWLRGNSPSHIQHGRIRVPRAFAGNLGRRVIVTSLTGQSARIFPVTVWAKLEEKLASIRGKSDSIARFLDRTKYYGSVQLVGPNSEVDIPEPLRSDAGLTDEVDVLGQFNFLEVWSHQRLLAQLQREPFTDEDARALSESGM